MKYRKAFKIPGLGRVPGTQNLLSKSPYCCWRWDDVEDVEEKEKEFFTRSFTSTWVIANEGVVPGIGFTA